MALKFQVICMPGGVAPAADRYRPLMASVGDAAELHPKELEVYREDAPIDDYSIDSELDAIDRFADSLGLDQFHLVGYSAGGMMSLAYAGTRRERLRSLALFEPARIPGEPTAAEREFTQRIESKLQGLSGPEFMAAFVREQVKPGAEVPPPRPPDAEMRKRPAGLARLMHEFVTYRFDRNLLRECGFPVYYAYGSLSHDEQALKAGVLAQLFPDIHVHRFEGMHHFVPPDQIYTPEHVSALIELWRGAEAKPAR